MEDQKTQVQNQEPQVNEATATAAAEAPRQEARRGHGGPGAGGDRRGPRRERRENTDGIDSRIILIRRVSRMYHGGRRLRFSALVVVGDRNGQVGVAVSKGLDVASAQRKAVSKAKKSMIVVPLKGTTFPHEAQVKFKSSSVLLKPAAPGTGLVAGATVKAMLELAGVKDALTKVMGSTNKVNVAYATFASLKSLRAARL